MVQQLCVQFSIQWYCVIKTLFCFFMHIRLSYSICYCYCPCRCGTLGSYSNQNTEYERIQPVSQFQSDSLCMCSMAIVHCHHGFCENVCTQYVSCYDLLKSLHFIYVSKVQSPLNSLYGIFFLLPLLFFPFFPMYILAANKCCSMLQVFCLARIY